MKFVRMEKDDFSIVYLNTMSVEYFEVGSYENEDSGEKTFHIRAILNGRLASFRYGYIGQYLSEEQAFCALEKLIAEVNTESVKEYVPVD